MIFNPSHYLMGVRFDNWLRLLVKNRFRVSPGKLPQAAAITLTSLLLSPVALLEAAITARPIRRERLQPPVFILGHWRSGTTYLQNILSRDPQFAWCDPVSTTTFPYSRLLGGLLRPVEHRILRDARPMDNLVYDVDLPIEDTFAAAAVSPYSIIHMIAFPWLYQEFVKSAFVEDLSPRERNEWRKTYDAILRKVSLTHGSRRLLLKSPDNTARARELLEMYPDAKFVNIYRDPYVTVQSTIHMFLKQMERIRLAPLPEGDLEELLEDTITEIFRRMYAGLFQLQKEMKPGQFVELRYEDFVQHPLDDLKRIYSTLGLDGFEEACPRFEAYIFSQRDYVKNRFEISDRLRGKIDNALGFYMEHYGYPRYIRDREAG